MAAISGLPPKTVYDLLVSHGWRAIDETENVWLMIDPKDPKCEPLPLPKHGDLVDPEVMDWLAHSSGLGRAVFGAVAKHYAAPTP